MARFHNHERVCWRLDVRLSEFTRYSGYSIAKAIARFPVVMATPGSKKAASSTPDGRVDDRFSDYILITHCWRFSRSNGSRRSRSGLGRH